MDVLIPTLIVFGVASVIMSVGVFFKRRPLQGTCGGLASMMGECEVCDLRSQCIEKKTPQCDEHRIQD